MADKIIFEVVATAKGVKVVQQQTDKLATSTDRADKSTKKLDKSRDAYNRREKGAANISSNSTKNFSKMQQNIDGGGGSGGLVRAYALLAANVFALTAAFGVLSRSAQIDTLTNSMEVLSTTGGTFIKNLAKDMQEASGGAIDLAQAFRQVSLASSAGLSTKEIEGLTSVAKGAALSLGRDLPDAMDRIFRGAIKLEPEILDEIGLFVRVDEAAQKYARNNNKVVSSLSQVEKRQAFLNEILEQGGKKFATYAETIKPDPYVRLGAALFDISQGALSLVNKTFGPLLNFLADSKGALTAVFGVLVFSLIRLAVPAIGQFNQGLAENAMQAKKNADDYINGLKRTQSAQSEHTKKVLADKNKILERDMKETPNIYKRGSKEEKETVKAMRGATDNLVKQDKMQTRINDLMKKRGTLADKSNALVEEELRLLRQEKTTLDQIVKNEKLITAENNKQLTQDNKFLAGRTAEKLGSQALTSGAVAGVSGTAETSGVTAGFRDLSDTLRNGVVVEGEEARKALTGMQKATVGLKGSISILGVGLSNTMAALSPYLIAFAMLSPLLIATAKFFGLSSKEAAAFDDELVKLNDQTENLSKRFKTQTDQINSGTLSFLEQSRATLAFNKGIVEASEGTKALNEKLAEFKRNASTAALGWEAFKGVFGLDRETKTLEANLETVQKQIEGLVRKSGVEGAEDFIDIQGVKAYADQIVVTQAAEQRFNELRKNFKNTDGKGITTQQAELIEIYQRMSAANKNALTTEESLNTATKNSVPGRLMALGISKKLLVAIAGEARAQEILKDTMKKVVGTDLQFADSQEKSGDSARKETKRLEILTSVMDGANESIGKFTNQFQQKTKADDLNNSLSGMQDAIVGVKDGIKGMTGEELNDFFTKIEESDNAFSRLFSDAQIEEFKNQNTQAFTDMVNLVKEYQHNIIVTKNEQAKLTKQTKTMATLSEAGFKMTSSRFAKDAQNKKMSFTLSKQEHQLNMAAQQLDKEQLKIGLDILNGEGTMLEKEAKLLEKGLSRERVMAGQQSLLAQQNAEYEFQLTNATKIKNAEMETAKVAQAQLKAKKDLNASLEKQAKLEAQLQSLQTRGTTKLTPAGEARTKIEAAQRSFELTKAEVELKMTMLNLELSLQKIKLKVLRDSLDANDPLRREIGFMASEEGPTLAGQTTDSGLFGELNKASETAEKALQTQLDTLGPQLRVTLAEIIEEGFAEGTAAGVLRSAETLAALRNTDEFKNANEKDQKGMESEVAAANIRGAMMDTANAMKEMGPEGEFVSSVIQGALAIGDAYSDMQESITNGADGAAAAAAFAGAALGQINQMMQANSQRQIKAIDSQIAAEKKRDGKSAGSLAKIKAMEAKKEAMKKKAFEQDKKMKMAQVIANTASAVIQSFANAGGFPLGMGAAAAMAALGAAQLAIIAKTKYEGGGQNVEKPTGTALTIGKRDNKVDVSRGATRGELAYMRGARGQGTNANNFTPTGGAYGMRSYAHSGEGILVGEQGPEVIQPTQPVDVLPMNSGGAQNVNFTINAVDAEGIESVLENQRGNIIGMIRSAANGYGTGFLEEVDTDVVSSGGYQKA